MFKFSFNLPVDEHERYQQKYEIEILKDFFVSFQKLLELISSSFNLEYDFRSSSFCIVKRQRVTFVEKK